MSANSHRLTVLDYTIILLTVATAIIHFTRVFPGALFMWSATA